MQKFGLKLIYNYENSFELIDNMKLVIEALGFEPQFMDIYMEDDVDLTEIRYNTDEIFKNIELGAHSILIKNKIYEFDNRDELSWFRLDLDDEYYNIYSLEWNNVSLFLFDTVIFQNLRSYNNFICGQLFDSEDVASQSDKRIDYTKQHSHLAKTTDQFGEMIIDTSKNWGRLERAAKLDFIAAPKMWFGQPYFKIIPKEKLLNFPNAEYLQDNTTELVFINLFNPKDKPDRNRQKEFWTFFDLENVRKKYLKTKHIDPQVFIKNELKRNRKKR